MLNRILFDEAPGEGGGNAPADPSNTDLPQSNSAADIVLSGTRTEREIELEKRNADLLADKKKVETRNAELEDENFQLKQPTTAPAPADIQKKGWRWRPFQT